MILEGKTETLVLEDGEVQDSVKMEIDADSHIFMMRMLSKFYSDNIGSPIREVASNALDSHRECGVDQPIIVGFKRNNDGNYEFSVEDFGCGLDITDVDKVISKYGKSTKRNSNTQLGAFGLGFKSPLAYNSSFYFIGRKNGIERKWMMYESDDEENKIDLLHEKPTKEKNGVKIVMSVKYSDRVSFTTKIKQQLAYFESVYFDCPGDIINEHIKIVRSEHFQWSSLAQDGYMHICLDNVYYPIDWDKLGIARIQLPMGLRFSLSDGLFPIPNREQLKYTNESKKIIIDKIKLVADYFITKYNESVKDTDDIFKLIDYMSSNYKNVTHPNGKDKLEITCLKQYSDIKFLEPKLNGIKHLSMRKIYDLRNYLFNEYTIKHVFRNGRFNDNKKRSWKTQIDLRDVTDNKIYKFTDLIGLKKLYLRDTLGSTYNEKYFVKKDKPFILGNSKDKWGARGNTLYYILGLSSIHKSKWRGVVEDWQYLVSLVESKFTDVDKIEISKDWTEGRKKQRVQKMIDNGTNIRRKKLTGEVTGKVSSSLERYVSGKNCKFVTKVFPMKTAHKEEYFVVYGNELSEPLFQKLYKPFQDTVKFVIFSDRELKNLKDIELHNWMEINKFMEGKHRIFRRTVTAYLIHTLKEEYSSVFDRGNMLKEVSTTLGEKVEKLTKYCSEYYKTEDKETYESMVKVAEEFKLFDTSIYDVYKEVQYILNRLPFIEPMFSKMSYSKETEMIKAVRDLCKYYKQRIDWQYYKLPINEEVKEEIKVEETVLDEN